MQQSNALPANSQETLPLAEGAATRKRAGRNFTSGPASDSSRDEMNLAEFPLAVLSTRVNPDVKTLEFTDHLRKPNGELVERKWIITAADKFGLPTSTDDDVVLGLIRMTMDQGFRDPKVYFTRYELLKTLRWSTEGRSYSRLIKSLDRLSGVRIRSTNSFYDNTTKSYQTCNFGIIDAYEINDERGMRAGEDDGDAPRKSFFIWSEMLFDSFKAGFVKKLDLEFYFSLKSAVSRRLYRYLDKHFYYRSTVETPLTVLAFEKIGLSRSCKYTSSIKQQVEPGAQELLEKGFLSNYEFVGTGQGTVVRFAAKRVFAAPQVLAKEAIAEPSLETVVDTDCVAALVRRGISEPQAVRLLQGKTPAEIKKIGEIVRYYDLLVKQNDRKISRSPVGFLYRAVEGVARFVLPQSFDGGEGTTARRTNRPELKIFTSQKGKEPVTSDTLKEKADRDAYREYVSAAVAKITAQFAETELKEMRQAIEKKMVFLRPILVKERFEEAVDGCLREELQKCAGVLSFEIWQRQAQRSSNA